MTGKPPRFNPTTAGAPVANAVIKMQNRGMYRTSPRERGYDSRWDRLSIRFRKQNPWCKFCRQQGRDSLTAVSDHVLPAVEFPELKYDWKNLIPLCGYHHNTTKQQMEIEARKMGNLAILRVWVDDPSTRPLHLRPRSEIRPT